MAQLVYDETGRLLFTQEMKQEYTLLMPQMLPVHFGMMVKVMQAEGYHVEILNTTHRGIVDEGLKYVHNDTCYPALLVIGQLMDALKRGGYDLHKVALLLPQTGGGCRASNYVHLLRKALEKAGMPYIPVVSVNLSGMEKNPGFRFTLPMLRRMLYAMAYGDLLVDLRNQVRPYEVQPGAAEQMVERWMEKLTDGFARGEGINRQQMRENFQRICEDFAAIPVEGEEKIRVGIVGEIYVKFAPLGNNNLEQFLLSEGVEPVVPGLLHFIMYCIHTRITDVDLYGGSKITQSLCKLFLRYVDQFQRDMAYAIRMQGRFRAPGSFDKMHSMIDGYLGDGNKMGEGWLLPAEMLELIHSGTNNIVCTQPFGCLPNHIVGKGMIRKLKDDYPYSNVVAIDYDPGATRINQENRIKLMLANARTLAREAENVPERQPAPQMRRKLAHAHI